MNVLAGPALEFVLVEEAFGSRNRLRSGNEQLSPAQGPGGIDIGEYTGPRVFQMLDAFQRVFTAMMDAGKPVMVVVNGPAIGGGSELAAFGDLVIATPKARFAQPEISIGVFPPLASTILPFLVGPKRALEIVLTGEAITAERALDLGLVNRLVPEAQLEKILDGAKNETKHTARK